MSKKPPFTRMCIACKVRMLKDDMKKVNIEGVGKSAYICKKCIDKVVAKRMLNKVFRRKVEQEIYDELGE